MRIRQMCLLLVGLGVDLLHPNVARAQTDESLPTWNARLSDHDGRLRLIVSTKGLVSNTYLFSVRCKVNFYNSAGASLGTEEYFFTKADEKLLPSVKPYEKKFSHGFAAATRVVGVTMKYSSHIFGAGAGWNPMKPLVETRDGAVDPDPELQV